MVTTQKIWRQDTDEFTSSYQKQRKGKSFHFHFISPFSFSILELSSLSDWNTIECRALPSRSSESEPTKIHPLWNTQALDSAPVRSRGTGDLSQQPLEAATMGGPLSARADGDLQADLAGEDEPPNEPTRSDLLRWKMVQPLSTAEGHVRGSHCPFSMNEKKAFFTVRKAFYFYFFQLTTFLD